MKEVVSQSIGRKTSAPFPPGPKGHPILGVMPAFNRQRISSYGDVMVDYSERMISSWKAGETRDVHRDMMRLTLEIVAKTLFNADVSGDADRVGAILSKIVKPFASQATIKWILD